MVASLYVTLRAPDEVTGVLAVKSWCKIVTAENKQNITSEMRQRVMCEVMVQNSHGLNKPRKISLREMKPLYKW